MREFVQFSIFGVGRKEYHLFMKVTVMMKYSKFMLMMFVACFAEVKADDQAPEKSHSLPSDALGGYDYKKIMQDSFDSIKRDWTAKECVAGQEELEKREKEMGLPVGSSLDLVSDGFSFVLDFFEIIPKDIIDLDQEEKDCFKAYADIIREYKDQDKTLSAEKFLHHLDACRDKYLSFNTKAEIFLANPQKAIEELGEEKKEAFKKSCEEKKIERQEDFDLFMIKATVYSAAYQAYKAKKDLEELNNEVEKHFDQN